MSYVAVGLSQILFTISMEITKTETKKSVVRNVLLKNRNNQYQIEHQNALLVQ